MTPPQELRLSPSQLATQTQWVYGAREAGMICEKTYPATLEEMGLVARKASPLCFHHEKERVVIGGSWR